MGRVVAKAQTISPADSGLASMTEMTLYSPYNYDGSVSAVTYPSQRVVSYGYNQSQRRVSAIDNTSIYTHFVSGAHYDAPGMLTSATHGDGINDTNHFNNRIQPTLLSAASGSQSLLNLTYGYQQTTPSIANNGTVLQIVNGLRNPGDNRSLAFTYDQLNRLQSAGTLSDATSPWSTAYSYDPWGNLYQKSTTGAGAGNGEVNQGPFTVNNQNRLNPDTFTYDAAGNMQSDIYNPLNFDGENQVHPASGIQYYYDGDGHRVAKSDGSRYWYDDNFKVLSTADSSNTLKRDYFYFNGTRLGWVTVASGDAHYYLNDHLGSPRVIANGDGSFISWEADYRPYGQDNVISNNDGLDVFFLSTGYEYDYEMNPDADYYANLRYMSASLGRFFQPDPVGGDPTIPQSWNRYAYALNNPTNFVDPLGLDVAGNAPDLNYSCYSDGSCDISVSGGSSVTVNGDEPGSGGGFGGFGGPHRPMPLLPLDGPVGGGVRGGSSGTVVSQAPPNKASNGNKTRSEILDCAAEKANELSLAGVLDTKNPIVNAFVGNTFSGLNDLRKDFSADNGSFAVDVIFGGAGQGLPIRGGPATKGVAGIVTDLVVNAATKPGTIQTLSGVTQLGEEGLAGPIGAAKVVYDFGTFLYGVGVCR